MIVCWSLVFRISTKTTEGHFGSIKQQAANCVTLPGLRTYLAVGNVLKRTRANVVTSEPAYNSESTRSTRTLAICCCGKNLRSFSLLGDSATDISVFLM
jgi:hypothetical protein